MSNKLKEKIEHLFSDLKTFQSEVVGDSTWTDDDEDTGLLERRSESTSSRDTLSSLYSNPMIMIPQNEHKLKHEHERLYATITPPASSNNSIILPSGTGNGNSNNSSDVHVRDLDSRPTFRINTVNLPEEKLYNLTPPRSPTRSKPPTASIRQYHMPSSKMMSNRYDFDYAAKSRDESDIRSWLRNSSSSGSIVTMQPDTEPSQASISLKKKEDGSDSIPATELLKRAAGEALKAGSKKFQDLLKLHQPTVDVFKRISASSSYSYQERRSIDSTAPSLLGGRASNASLSTIPTFKRSSNMKILLSEDSNRGPTYSPLGRIEEEEECESGMLKRALSWPRRNHITSFIGSAAADATLSGYEPAESFDSAIFSIYLLKKNRRGQFQKRLIRCDGTLLICMSSHSAYIRKGTVSEYDFLESPHDIVKKDLYNAIRDFYPPGTSISSLARNLVSVGGNGTAPDPNSKIYYVPKWVIPVSKITKFQCKQTVTGTPTTKHFNLHSSCSTNHAFQTYSYWETGVLKELLERMINQLPQAASMPLYADADMADIMSDSVQVSVAQQVSMNQYMQNQSVWKRVIGDMVRSDHQIGPKVTTIQIDATGANVFRGLVLQPATSSLSERAGVDREFEKGEERLNLPDFSEYSRFDSSSASKIYSSASSSDSNLESKSKFRNGRIFKAESERFSEDISHKINEIDRLITRV